MNQDDLVKKSMEYFKSIAHTIVRSHTLVDQDIFMAYAMILVTRAYEEGYRDGYADGAPTERAEGE